jgi:hypothetical protein
MKVFPHPPRRSPFKRQPLRSPGQSVQREMDRLLEDRMLPILMFATMMGFMAVYDWTVVLLRYTPKPYLSTSLFLLGTGYATYKYFDFKRTVERLRLGRDGERIVGQFLEDLRADGARVFHDLVGDGLNIDHVVVSPHGIFVLETKSWSKPGQGDAVIQYDGERLLRHGVEFTRHPVRQVQALARWLADQLGESTGRQFPIRPVVLLPGWFVEVATKRPPEVWVLNPKQLGAFIAREPVALTREDVALVSSRIIQDMQKP